MNKRAEDLARKYSISGWASSDQELNQIVWKNDIQNRR